MEAAGACRNPLVKPIIELAVETGMRRGEILGMKWDHYDPVGRSLLIPLAKNGSARTIPVSARVQELLGRIPRQGAQVFPISANALRLTWGRVTRRAGVDDLHFHDLRHEAISRLFERGLTAPEVSAISGHRDPRMLFRYSHAIRETILRKLDGSARAGLSPGGAMTR